MALGGRRFKWLIGAVVVVLVLAIGGPFVFIHFVEGKAPAKLQLPVASASGPSTTAGSEAAGTGGSSASSSGSSGSTAATTSVDGTWNVGSGSIVGYRVGEVLIGQSTTAVGRTSKVWGALTISGSTATTGSFTADMASVTSDQSQRNAQFDTRIMDVSTYPTATFKLTGPIQLGSIPAGGTIKQFSATGTLDMHGVTKSITFTLSAERSGSSIFVLADIPITFAEWNIANPSVGGFVTTQNSGTLEVLLALTKGAGNPVSVSSGGSGGFGGGGQITVPPTTVPTLTVPASS